MAGEIDEGPRATRMIRDERYKLIYYSAGNHRQLFDMEDDPWELVDLSDSPNHVDVLERLTNILISQLYGGDEEWMQDGRLVRLPDNVYVPGPNRALTSQRGAHWPPPPASNMPQINGIL